MSINFPASPSLGQTYTSGSNSWKWNGASWVSANIGTNPIFISVKDYGARGDGVTDDTAAINACLDDFRTYYSSGVWTDVSVNIFFPRGKYLISSSLWVSSGQNLYGEGLSSLIFTNNVNIKQLIKLCPAIDHTVSYTVNAIPTSAQGASPNFIITSLGSTTTQQWNTLATITGWNGNSVSVNTGSWNGGTPQVGDTFTLAPNLDVTTFGTGTVTRMFPGVSSVSIKNIGLQTAKNPPYELLSDAWAIKTTCGYLGESEIRDIYLDSKYGLSLATYTQSCIIDHVLVRNGSVEQMLHLSGNRNYISNIDKDDGGTAGTTTNAIILIDAFALGPMGSMGAASNGNILYNILIEGACNSIKPAIKCNVCEEVVIENIWLEMPDANNGGVYNGNAIVLQSVNHAQFKGYLENSGITQNTYIYRCGEVIFDVFMTQDWSSSYSFSSHLNVDALSSVRIKKLISSIGANVIPTNSAGNIIIEQVFMRATDYIDTTNRRSSTPQLVSSNSLINPSFEAGLYGWNVTGTISSSSFDPSYFSFGKAATIVWSNNSYNEIYQNFTITSSMVGKPFTFSCYLDVLTGSSSAYVAPLLSGAGVTQPIVYQRVYASTGIHFVTQTVIPSQTGTMKVGVLCSLVPSFKIGDCSFVAGNIGTPNQTSIKSISLDGKTILYASSPPSNGGWKVGSRVLNDTPANGQPKGWICTASTGGGSTWVSEGDLGAGGGSSSSSEPVSADTTATVSLTTSQIGNLIYTGTADGNWSLPALSTSTNNGLAYRIYNASAFTLYLWSSTPSTIYFVEPYARSTYDPTTNNINTMIKGYAIPSNSYIDVVSLYNGTGNPYWLVRDNKGCIAASPPGTSWY